MKANPNYSRPTDIKLIAQGLEKAKPWGLEAEFTWSLAVHFKTYPTDPIDLAVQTALDDWDLDD
jgi:hypothetical protein|tara:strand:- start:410 stop:601 length:192 start_codon:yes stop_codon:yes gene_type:complete